MNKLTGWGSSVLHMAAHRGAQSIVITLLECGADVNIRDDNCDTPLHLACSEVDYFFQSCFDIQN